MSRLADRIRAEARVVPGPAAPALGPAIDIPNRLRSALDEAAIFLIDEVADYFWSSEPYDAWRLERDFPQLAPPYELAWYEYRLPVRPEFGREAGAAVGVLATSERTDTGWRSELLSLYERRDSGAVVAPLAVTVLEINPTGGFERELSLPLHEDASELEFLLARAALLPTLFATTLLHCKNVTVERHEIPARLAKAQARRRGLSARPWHSIAIDPGKQILASAGAGGGSGLKRAMHRTRAHWGDYREGRGLFGRVHGLFFFSEHVSGSGRLPAAGSSRYVVRQPRADAGDGPRASRLRRDAG